jgi:c-di-GMP-binding flagellar brake protein YcgR
MQAHPFPEPDSPDLDPFLVRDPLEVRALLREITNVSCQANVYVGDDAFFVVSVTGMDESDEYVLLTQNDDASSCPEVDHAGTWTVVLFHAGVKIQFRCPAGQRHRQGLTSIWLVPLPNRVIRLQRRLAPRARPEATRRPFILVPMDAGKSHYDAWAVVDISLLGVSVLAPDACEQVDCGMTYTGCFLHLPDRVPLATDLRILNAYDAIAGQALRYGCQWSGMLPADIDVLSRYLADIPVGQTSR